MRSPASGTGRAETALLRAGEEGGQIYPILPSSAPNWSKAIKREVDASAEIHGTIQPPLQPLKIPEMTRGARNSGHAVSWRQLREAPGSRTA